MTRAEFSAKTKEQAFARAGGQCENCGVKLFPGNIDYDHRIPCEQGGGNDLGNCQVLCVNCHRGAGGKTSQDAKTRARARKARRSHIGAKKPKRKMPYRTADGVIHWNGKET